MIYRLVLFRACRNLDLLTRRRRPNVYLSLLDSPDPVRQSAVQTCVQRNGSCSEVFCIIEAEFEVPVEGRGGKSKCGVAKAKADIRECVGLREFEGVQVIWNGIVGGVFQIFRMLVICLMCHVFLSARASCDSC